MKVKSKIFSNQEIKVGNDIVKIDFDGSVKADETMQQYLLSNFPNDYIDIEAEVVNKVNTQSNDELDLTLQVTLQELESVKKELEGVKKEKVSAQKAIEEWKKEYEKAKNSVPSVVKEGLTGEELQALYDLAKSSKAEMQETAKAIEGVEESEWSELTSKELFVFIATKAL